MPNNANLRSDHDFSACRCIIWLCFYTDKKPGFLGCADNTVLLPDSCKIIIETMYDGGRICVLFPASLDNSLAYPR